MHFDLAGINDENFLMRDRETGSWWQQSTGEAISGPLRGAHLKLLSAEEISFGLWRREYPLGTVLAPVAADRKRYIRAGWVKRSHKIPVVVAVPNGPLHGRSLVIGVHLHGQARAYPYRLLFKNQLINDRLSGVPILVTLGPDRRTVRVFVRRAPGLGPNPEFFQPIIPSSPAKPVAQPAASRHQPGAGAKLQPKPSPLKPTAHKPAPFRLQPWMMLDAATGSQWNFRGCAVQGKLKGECLRLLTSLNEDWFNWHHDHPQSTIFQPPGTRFTPAR